MKHPVLFGTEKLRFACWITKARIQTHTYNTKCLLLSAATIVTQKLHNVTLQVNSRSVNHAV